MNKHPTFKSFLISALKDMWNVSFWWFRPVAILMLVGYISVLFVRPWFIIVYLYILGIVLLSMYSNYKKQKEPDNVVERMRNEMIESAWNHCRVATTTVRELKEMSDEEIKILYSRFKGSK